MELTLMEFAEQVRSVLLRKTDDVDTAQVEANPIFDDSQVVIGISTFDGQRFVLTLEQD